MTLGFAPRAPTAVAALARQRAAAIGSGRCMHLGVRRHAVQLEQQPERGIQHQSAEADSDQHDATPAAGIRRALAAVDGAAAEGQMPYAAPLSHLAGTAAEQASRYRALPTKCRTVTVRQTPRPR